MDPFKKLFSSVDFVSNLSTRIYGVILLCFVAFLFTPNKAAAQAVRFDYEKILSEGIVTKDSLFAKIQFEDNRYKVKDISILDHQELFYAVDSLIYIYKKTEFDYETTSYYNIPISIRTTNDIELTDTLDLYIKNINEKPTINDLSNRTIDENPLKDTFIAIINAFDPDSNSVLSFDFKSDFRDAFTVRNDSLFVGPDTTHFNYEINRSISLIIVARDEDGLTDNKEFLISINDINEAPTSMIVSVSGINENPLNGSLIGELSTVDEDSNDKHSYKLHAEYSPITLNGNQLIVKDSTYFNYEKHPYYDFNITTTDLSGLSYTDNLRIIIQDVNEKPFIITPASLNLSEDTTSDSLVITILDPETPANDIIIDLRSSNKYLFSPYSHSLLPGKNDSTRILILDPLPNAYGNTVLTLVSNDGLLQDSSIILTKVLPVNDPPFFPYPPLIELKEGDTHTIKANELKLSDYDNTPKDLTIHLVNSPKYGELLFNNEPIQKDEINYLDIIKGKLSYRHDSSENHSDRVLLYVTDKSSKTDTVSLNITIEPVNDAPFFRSKLFDRIINEDDSTGTISFLIGDKESPSLDLSVQVISSNLNLISKEGIRVSGIDNVRTLDLKPNKDANGTARIDVIISDGELSTKQSFLLKVKAINDYPDFVNLKDSYSVQEGKKLVFSFTIQDPDNSDEDISVEHQILDTYIISPYNVKLEKDGKKYTYIISTEYGVLGEAEMILNVSDGNVLVGKSTKINVTQINLPPTNFSLIGAYSEISNDSLLINFRWTPSEDPDINNNPNLSYTLKIRGNKVDTLVNNIKTNSYDFIANSKFESFKEYEWWVISTDNTPSTDPKIDSTYCDNAMKFSTPFIPDTNNWIELEQNYPNPFSESTSIRYILKNPALVKITIYDLSGKKITELTNEIKTTGIHIVNWTPGGNANGSFICKLQATSTEEKKSAIKTIKMTVFQ